MDRSYEDLNGTINASILPKVRCSSPADAPGQLPLGRIAVSLKWKQTELVRCLQKSLQVIFIQESGNFDFYPSEEMAVVYVTEADCLVNEGCRKKLAKLRNTKRVRGIVLFEKSAMTANYFNSIQKFAVLELGLVLLTVSDQTDAAQLLQQMVGLENKFHNNPFQVKGPSPVFDEMIFETIRTIPGLGEVKAKQLVERYKSLKNISNATVEELTPVIGRGPALKVHQFFR